MLPLPSTTELRRRMPPLLFGLVIFGFGLALMVIADLGLAPWDVLHQGISKRTGIPIGTVVIIVGVLLLVLWIPLKERIGIGTIANAIVIGVVLDLSLLVLPDRLTAWPLQWAALLVGVVLVGIGSGYYIGAGLAPGPRDGLMTGIARLGPPIFAVRAAIELSVLVVGWLLGGTVGVGTVLFALAMGPLVHFFMGKLSLHPVPDRA